MAREYEIKVLDIDVAAVRSALVTAGFEEQGTLNFRRYIYDLDESQAWIRLRTDGTRSTLTYKKFLKDAIDGVEEIEVEVSDFDKTNELLEHVGHTASKYQENRRHLYTRDSVEVSIDEWPHIPPYLEIEAHNEATVTDWLEQLGLRDLPCTSETTTEVYKRYGLDIDAYQHLHF